MVFISLRGIFLSYLRFYFFMLKELRTKSILLVLMPFMMNLEYKSAVELLCFCITAGISGMRFVNVDFLFVGVVMVLG